MIPVAVWHMQCYARVCQSLTRSCPCTYVPLLPPEKQKQLLEMMCGVVSERTKRLCSRSINCPQHSEDQRRDIRVQLCGPSDSTVSPATKKKATHHSMDDDISGVTPGVLYVCIGVGGGQSSRLCASLVY